VERRTRPLLPIERLTDKLIPAQHGLSSLTSLLRLSLSSSSSFRSTIPIPGASTCFLALPMLSPFRWHEQDPEELQRSCEQCIDEATEKLEQAGFARSSIKVLGITNQRETTVAWSRRTGKSLCRAIVWDDARTKNIVAHYERKLKDEGIRLEDGSVRKGDDGVKALRELWVITHVAHEDPTLIALSRTGLPLSTYFSAIKLRWMIQHHEEVRKAHDEDDLLFGTVESWIVYVCPLAYWGHDPSLIRRHRI
jgi:glycerol kinase